MFFQKLLIFFILILKFCTSLQNYFVSNLDQCPLNSICDGSFINPFAGLISAFSQAIKASHISQDFSIIFHLISEDYVITDKQLQSLSENQNIKLYNYTYQFFENNILIVPSFYEYFKIKPYLCLNDSSPCSTKINIHLKTENFSLAVAKIMNIENINWQGNNLPFSQIQSSDNCLSSSNKNCCNIEDLFDVNSSNCLIKGYNSSNRGNLANYDYYHGLFQYKFSHTSLNLIGCSFNYMISISRNNLMGYLFLIGSYVDLTKKYDPKKKTGLYLDYNNLNVKNCSFESNYFLYGIIYFSNNTNNNTNITLLNNTFSNYNIFKILDSSQSFNNFTIVISNSTLNLESVKFINSSNVIYSDLKNQISIKNCSMDLIYSIVDYNSILFVYGFMLNYLKVSEFSFNIPWIDIDYTPSEKFEELSAIEDQTRSFYFPTSYCLFTLLSNNSFELENSIFNDIQNIGLISIENYTNITIQNLKISKILIIDKYFIQIRYNNIFSLSDAVFVDITNNDNPFISIDSFNNLTILNFNVNKTVSICLFYGRDSNEINVSNSYFIDFTAQSYASFMFLLSKHTVRLYNILIDTMHGEGSSSCLYMVTQHQLYINDSTIMNVVGSEGSVFYLSDDNIAYITRVVTLNSIATLDTIYFGRNYNNILFFDNCSFFVIEGTIAQATFDGYLSLNNIYVKGDTQVNTRVLINAINTVAYLNNSLIEDCYSETFGGLIYSQSDSFVYLTNNTFLNNIMYKGTNLVMDYNCFAEINDCVFVNSSALSFGGSVYLEKQNSLFIFQTIFVNSSSKNNAGTIYSYYLNEIFLYDCSFNYSQSDLYGGLIEIEEKNVLNVILCKFDTINVLKGGLLYAKTGNSISINDSILSNCSANIGAMIYLVNFNVFNMTNFTASNCSVIGSGGIIFSFLNNTILIENSRFSFISSENLAGGFYLDTNNILIINGCFFLNVSSENSGGLIYAVLKNEMTFNSSTISNSSLTFGNGAILFDLGISNILTNEKCIWVGLVCFYSSYAINLETNNKIIFLNNFFEAQVQSNFEGFIRANQNNTIKMVFSQIVIDKEPIQSGFFIQMLKNNIMEASNLNISVNYNLDVFEIFGGSSANFESSNFNNMSKNFYLIKLMDYSKLNFTNIKLIVNKDESISSVNSDIYLNKCIFSFETANPREIDHFMEIEGSNITVKSSKFINNFREMKFLTAKNSNILLKKNEFIGFLTSQSGSIVYGEEIKTIQISGCLFIKNKASQNGGVLSVVMGTSQLETIIKFSHNIFINNQAFFKGGAVEIELMGIAPTKRILIKTDDSIIICNSSHILNKASYGGALFVKNFYLTELEYNLFKNNEALENMLDSSERSKGGAIYLSNIPKVINSNNFFIKNKAEIGGAFFFDKNDFVYQEKGNIDILFQENKIKYYGVDKASNASTIGFLQNLKNENTNLSNIKQNLSITDVASGQNVKDCLFYIVGIDKFKNIAFNSDEIIPFNLNLNETINPIKDSTLSNDYSYNITNGFICVQSFQRKQSPLKSTFKYYLNLSQTNIMSESYLTVSFRDCQLGEKLTKDSACEPCPSNKYSLVKDFSSSNDCFQCKNLEFNCLGGFNITPTSGYWRFNNLSINFMKCPQVKHCLGGIVTLESIEQRQTDFPKIFTPLNKIGDKAYSLTGFCSLGYAGILCNECDEDYGKVNAFTCYKCYENGYNGWITMQILIKLSLILISLHISLVTSVSIFMGDVKEKNMKMTYLIKIFFNHIQILIILFAFIDITDPFNDIIGFSLGFSSNVSEAFNLECLIKNYHWNISPIYFQFWVSLIYWIPLALLILLYSYYIFRKKKKEYEKLNNPKLLSFKFCNLFVAAILILLDLCYFDMINTSFKLFNCVNVNDEFQTENRLLFDYSVRCDTTYHNSVRYVSLFIVILGFGLGFPFTLFGYLYNSYQNKRLDGDSCSLKVSYFYYVYERKYFFWDIIHILRKLLALGIQILLSSQYQVTNNISLQILLIVVLCLLFLQIRLRPYDLKKYDVINRLEQYSLISLTLSIYLLLLFNSLLADEQSPDLGLEVFFFVVALLANLAFAILWFYIYIPEKKREISRAFTGWKKNIILGFSKKKINSLDSLPRMEIVNSKNDFCDIETKTRFELGSKNLLLNSRRIDGVSSLEKIHYSPLKKEINEKLKNDNEKNLCDLMKINEKYYLQPLLKKNLEIFENRNLNASLNYIIQNEKDQYFHRNFSNVKFVKNMFMDKIPLLYECTDMAVGIEFFDLKGCSMTKKARITFQKGFQFVKFKSLKFKSPDSKKKIIKFKNHSFN